MTNQSYEARTRLLSATEAAVKLGISKTGFRRKVAEHKAPAPVRIGHRTLWLESEIDQLITQLIEQRDPK